MEARAVSHPPADVLRALGAGKLDDAAVMPNFRYKLTRDQILALSIYIRSFAIKESGAVAKPALPTSAAGLTEVQIFRAFCVACHNRDGKGGHRSAGHARHPRFHVGRLAYQQEGCGA
jgi:cytochrome c